MDTGVGMLVLKMMTETLSEYSSLLALKVVSSRTDLNIYSKGACSESNRHSVETGETGAPDRSMTSVHP